jgi:hypothetical protein
MGSLLRKMSRARARSGTTHATASPAAGHRFIEIGKYHRNEKNAEEYVLELFRKRAPSAALPEVRTRMFREGEGENLFEISFRTATTEARERGSAEGLRTYLNNPDPDFPFTIGMSSDVEGPSFKVTFASQEMTLNAPMRQQLIEGELTDDILEHRRNASAHSTHGEDEFQRCALHFRGYLLSSCALVEAFLNRGILVANSIGKQSEALAELQKPCNMERRFELWLHEFCGAPLTSIKGGAEWDHYQELRTLRNHLMHATGTMLGLDLKVAARQLNLVRRGVGGLINSLRKLQQRPPLSFAERLETAPETRFASRGYGRS